MNKVAPANIDFLSNGGEMGERIRSFDWTSTPLGEPHLWEQSLKTCVRIILTSAQPMFVWWGPERINIYNDAYAQIMGKKHPAGLGIKAEDVWNEIWPSLVPKIESVERNEGTYDDSYFFIMERKGYQEEVYVSFCYSPAPGDDGTVKGLFCVCTETTERIVADRQLKTLKNLTDKVTVQKTIDDVYSAAIKALSGNDKDFPFAILYKFDESTKIAQPVAYAGITRDQEVFPRSINVENGGRDAQNFCKAFSTKSILVSENKGRRKNLPKGHWAAEAIHFIHIPIVIPGKEHPVAMISAAMNPYRIFDDSFRQFVITIGDQVGIAVNNVLSFEQQKKKAEALTEIDKAKTVFFSNISHEFRTPLTLMLGPIEEALDEPATIPVNRARLQVVHRNTLRMQKLVNNLLDFSRIEAGRINAHYEPIKIGAFTIDLASTFRSVIEKEGIEFVVDCPSHDFPVWVDKDMWEKIVLNLLSNAFKFTREGQILVRVREENGWVQLIVKDTGVGIPRDEQEKIFERFHRVQNANGRTFEGTGIGLALINELVKLHDGTIHLESEINVGSSFTVTIPVKNSRVSDKQQIPEQPVVSSHLAESFVQESLRWSGDDPALTMNVTSVHDKKYILIVDDNSDMRFYLGKILSKDYEVKTVADGNDAWAAIQERKPHLVLSDIMMPGMDGFELLHAIKSNELTRSVQVILLSARAGEESVNEGLQKGADGYLVKPFSAQQLKTILANRLTIQESQDKIEKSERLLQRLFRQAPFSLTLLEGEDFIFKLINDKASELLTLPQEEIIGKPLFEIVPEMEAEGYREIFSRVLQTGQPFTAIESPGSFKRNGKVVTGYFDYVCEPMYDEKGKVKGIIALSIEVTDKVLARRKLEESESQFRTMASEAPLFVWVTDDHLQTTFLNKRGLDYFNLGEDILMKKLSWKGFIHPEDLKRVLQTMKESASTGKPYSLEMRLKNGITGKYRWFLDQGVPRYSREKFTGFIGTSLDINDRKEGEELLEQRVKKRTQQLEEKNLQLQQQKEFIEQVLASSRDLVAELENSRSFLQQLIDSSIEYIFVLDSDLNIITVNRRFEDRINMGRKDVQGKHIFEIHPRAEGSDFHDGLLRALNGELVYLDKRQSIKTPNIYVDTYIIPFIQHNKVEGVIVMSRDVSDIVKSENLLEQKNRELESTILMIRDQELKDQLKDKFIQIASHELKTPLTSIKAYAQLLARSYSSSKDDFLKNGLTKVDNQVNKMTKLVNDLLNLTKIESGKWTIEKERIDITELVEEVAGDLQIVTETHRIIFEKPTAQFVMADKEQIAQVLINLMNNAVKYSPSDEKIEVTIQPNGSWVTVSVTDHGIGIPLEEHDKIFQRFYRAEQKKNNFSGFGIGLFISSEIVNRHDGQIGVISEPGKGAQFYFRLPLAN